MKKIIIGILSAMLLINSVLATNLYIDTTKIETDVEPVLIDGRNLVPFRAIFEALGATVEWDSDDRAAVGRKDDITIKIPIDSTTVYVNDTTYTLDVPARIIDGRTMVPARFVAETLGCKVSWYQKTETIGVAYQLKDTTLYATPTGKKYHYDSKCNGGNYYETNLAEVNGRQLTACEKCVN